MRTDSATLPPLALCVEEHQLVRDIIDAAIPGAVVKVFGSRSSGRARRYSDLDLLFTQPAHLSLAQRAELRQRFEASPLPYRIDLVEVDALAPGMADRVRAECQRLYHRACRRRGRGRTPDQRHARHHRRQRPDPAGGRPRAELP